MEASPTYSSPAAGSAASRFLRVQPDPVLCRLASRGNPSAFDVLYERYRQPVFAFVYHLLGRGASSEDAEDIAQEAFTKGFAAIRERGFEGSFKHWIFAIARNRTFDVMRARRPVGSLDAEAEMSTEAVDHRAATDDRAEQRAELAWLVTTVSELPHRQREALLLRELGGLSHREIAAELDTTVSATKKLINRGRSSVAEAAAADGYREKHLGRDLAMAAPVLPLAAGIGMTFTGGAATASAAAGGGAAFAKVAATFLTVAAVGGGTAVVEHERTKPPASDSADVAAAQDRAGSPIARVPAGTTTAESVIRDVADRTGGSRRGKGEDAKRPDRGSGSGAASEGRRGRGGETEAEGQDDRGGRRGSTFRGDDQFEREGSERSGSRDGGPRPRDDGSHSGSGSGSGSETGDAGSESGSPDSGDGSSGSNSGHGGGDDGP